MTFKPGEQAELYTTLLSPVVPAGTIGIVSHAYGAGEKDAPAYEVSFMTSDNAQLEEFFVYESQLKAL